MVSTHSHDIQFYKRLPSPLRTQPVPHTSGFDDTDNYSMFVDKRHNNTLATTINANLDRLAQHPPDQPRA